MSFSHFNFFIKRANLKKRFRFGIGEGPVVRRSQYSLAGTLLKTGFFRQVSELKIQRKNSSSVLRFREVKEKRREQV
jgi:hypothetical protein